MDGGGIDVVDVDILDNEATPNLFLAGRLCSIGVVTIALVAPIILNRQ